MKHVVISDIHSNYPALQAVMDDAPDYPYICLGDFLGINGYTRPTMNAVCQMEHVIRGNHDVRVLGCFAPRTEYEHTEHIRVTGEIEEGDVRFIEECPDTLDDPCMAAHSNPCEYPSNGTAYQDAGIHPKDITHVMSKVDTDMLLVGHTHYQKYLDVSKFEGLSGVFVNPGSVGYPHGEASYAIVDPETGYVDLRTVEYEAEFPPIPDRHGGKYEM